MSTFKRYVSLLLVLGILLGVLAPGAQAAPMEETATVNTDNVTIEGTNGFGELLSQELTKNQNETAEESSEYSGGYSVTDLEITDGMATVTYDSMEEATLVVALHTEDGMQLITSATATVTPGATEATVTFGGEMPEYFMASAYLLDSYDFSPLCASYETPMYTREMQELLESTVDDYDPDKVLNLDDDKTTNFAVYADSTVVIEPTKGVNTVATIDDENAVYVIKNADEQIKSLVEGDVFVYPYAEGELLIVKVETITINGTTATITGSNLELEEVFSYMKIENTGSTEDMIVVEDSGDEGVTYIGLQRKNKVNPSAWGDNAELQFSMGFNVEKEIDQYSSFSGSLGIQFDVEFEYYISLKRQFIRFEYGSEVAVKIGYQLQANAPIPKATSKLELKSFGYSPVAGVYLGFEPEIVVEFTATVEVACTLRASGGFSYESGKGADDLSKKPTVDIDIKFEGVIFFGIDFGPHISILKDNVAKIKLSSQVGLELTGKTTGSMFEDIILAGDAPGEKHDCELCITVDLAVKADFSLQIELLKCDWLTFECKLAAKRFKIGACYYSDTYDDFGWGECPHKLYRLTIVVIDEESRNIAGAVVTADKFTETTNQIGAAIFYLTDGTYTVEVNDGTLVKSKTVQISDPAKVSIKLDDGDNSVSEDDSALDWITGDIGSEDIIDQWHGYVVDTGTCGVNLYWELYEDGYLYIGGSGDMSSSPFDTELKEKIRFVEVGAGCTAIGYDAFRSCGELETVTIREGCEEIGNSAFAYCDELKTVTIEKGCKEIGSSAFYDCNMLATATLPNTLASIGSSAFKYCTAMSTINLPATLTEIGSAAFSDCTSLASVTLPNSLKTLGSAAFASSGLTSINIPGSVRKISYDAFRSCDELETVIIREGCEEIESSAFAYCDELKTVTIEKGCEEIGGSAFYDCNALTTVSLPTTLTSIGVSAFKYCTALSAINLPATLTEIGNAAFSDCTSLASVTLPNSLKTLGSAAFASSGLTSISIPGSVRKISYDAFRSCDELETVIIREGCEEIESSAFAYCDELKTVTIEKGCEEIGSSAFYNCNALTTVTLPSTLIGIGGSAFKYCTALSAINLPATLTEIGSAAFSDCTSLASVTLPNSLKTLGSAAFASSGLTSISIPGSVRKISYDAFRSCDELETVIIREGCEEIESSVFAYCDKLNAVYFLGDAPEIASNVFYTVTTTVNYPAGNATWTSDVMLDYGGTITWTPYFISMNNSVISYEEDAFTVAVNPDDAAKQETEHEIGEATENPKPESTPITTQTAHVDCVKDDIAKPNAVYPGEYDTEITDSYTLKTASFKNLVPSEQYVLLAMASIGAEDPLSADNLLFIDQAEALEDGTIIFQYVQRIPCDISYVVACGASSKNLHNAEITFPEMVSDGELQVIDPTVIYDGKTLTEGRDYAIMGKVDFTEAGEYICYIRGIRNYTGLVECRYTVKGTEFENPFTDVPDGSFYYDPVMWAVENGITAGATPTTFDPNGTCLRAHVVTFLHRAAGNPDPTSMKNPFADVKTNDFFYKPVLWAVEKGITNGVSTTAFGSYANCNRAAVVTFLWRAAGSPEPRFTDKPFKDVKTTDFFYKPVLWAVENGITNGVDTTHFSPATDCNRAQVVTFLYRAARINNEEIVKVASGIDFYAILKSNGKVDIVSWNDIVGSDWCADWTDIVDIDANNYFILGIQKNGSVVFQGVNVASRGDVGDWSDIKQVSAGAFFSVGLKRNGTVVAAGSNDDGECNVSDWTGIIAISAGSSHTVGLKADGTVVATGSNNMGQCDVAQWRDIIAIATGDGITIGLKADGTVVTTCVNWYYNNPAWTDIREAEEWTDVIAIDAGRQHIVALKSDGTVATAGFVSEETNSWSDVVAISAGGYHTIGFKEDGTILIVHQPEGT